MPDTSTANLAMDQCDWLHWLATHGYDYCYCQAWQCNIVIVAATGEIVARYYVHRPLYGVPTWYVWLMENANEHQVSS